MRFEEVKEFDHESFVLGRRGQLGEGGRGREGGGGGRGVQGERGMRGGQGDIVRNQRREQHKQRQHRLLNKAMNKTGESTKVFDSLQIITISFVSGLPLALFLGVWAVFFVN